MVVEKFSGLFEMLLTYARAFTVAAVNLEQIRGQLIHLDAVGHKDVMPQHEVWGENFKIALEGVNVLCADIPSLNKVCAQIERIHQSYINGSTASLLNQSIHELQSRIMEELADHYYYPVTISNAAFYSNPAPFGEVVSIAFPSAQNDIVNCVRCHVLGQPTASAFHAMRALEVSLRTFAKKIGIEYRPSWESYLKAIEGVLDKTHSQKTNAERKNAAKYREILGDLMSVKIAWRNPTMHVERRYEDSEAMQVLVATNILMQKLADSGIRERAKKLSLPDRLDSPGQ